jgi:ABC-type amino acid transport system permease subunit
VQLADLEYDFELLSICRVCIEKKEGPMSASEKDTLHLLAVFHYVIAGLIALAASFPLIHLAVGVSLAVGGVSSEEPVMGSAGTTLAVIAALLITIGWGFAVFIFIAGKNLYRQTKYQLCMVGAGVVCIFLPLGTILGVFTLVTLQEDSVKQLFDSREQSVSNER